MTEYISHEEYARRRSLKLIRQNQPPPPGPTAEEAEEERIVEKVSSRNVSFEMDLYNQSIEESREHTLLAVAVISLFVPGGFFLAVWPLISSKRAWPVALFSIFVGLFTAIFVWRRVLVIQL